MEVSLEKVNQLFGFRARELSPLGCLIRLSPSRLSPRVLHETCDGERQRYNGNYAYSGDHSLQITTLLFRSGSSHSHRSGYKFPLGVVEKVALRQVLGFRQRQCAGIKIIVVT